MDKIRTLTKDSISPVDNGSAVSGKFSDVQFASAMSFSSIVSKSLLSSSLCNRKYIILRGMKNSHPSIKNVNKISPDHP